MPTVHNWPFWSVWVSCDTEEEEEEEELVFTTNASLMRERLGPENRAATPAQGQQMDVKKAKCDGMML